MRERERQVTQRLADAKDSQAIAEQQRQALQAETDSIQRVRDELLTEARESADAERSEMLRDAREEVESQRKAWTQSFERDRQELADQSRRTIERLGFIAARHTLEQLADTNLQSQICHSLMRQLQTLNDSQLSEMNAHFDDSRGNVTLIVRSAMDLDDDDREQLTAAIGETFQRKLAIRFETDESLVCGLEIDTGGYSLSWNAAETLRKMEPTVA
jgi:F-type H+-transporting ATPase subunit b